MTNLQLPTLFQYKDILEKIENQECHLLLGNGFNRGLGINTGYSAIFDKMKENDHGIYKDVNIENLDFDLELFIEILLNDIKEENVFLRKYVANKVKWDFMKATNEIVKDGIKNIYAENNEGVYILLKNFTNYFTLNYDSFLYLLLLNYKLNKKYEIIAMQKSLNFIEKELNEDQDNIVKEIEIARNQGEIDIFIGNDGNNVSRNLKDLTKAEFVSIIKTYSDIKGKRWSKKDIAKVVDHILEKEKKTKLLNVDDGSKKGLFEKSSEFIFDVNKETQNLFFLHGAFHIYQDGKEIKKIIQTTDNALYDRLEEILNEEGKDIVCVFRPDNKIEDINKNNYLSRCYNKLSELSNIMVIIGSGLAENDRHIFDQINSSEIETIYISTTVNSYKKNYEKAITYFPKKKIIFFEAESISYKLPENIE